ncbi:MAG: hypothetical protein ACJAZP_000108 [Psychromonas sp.]|jgi:hypothetical protein
MLRKAGVDNQLSWVSLFTQLLKQPFRQANRLCFHAGLATAAAAFSAVITASLIGLLGHFDSLQKRIGMRKVDKCTLIKWCLLALFVMKVSQRGLAIGKLWLSHLFACHLFEGCECLVKLILLNCLEIALVLAFYQKTLDKRGDNGPPYCTPLSDGKQRPVSASAMPALKKIISSDKGDRSKFWSVLEDAKKESHILFADRQNARRTPLSYFLFLCHWLYAVWQRASSKQLRTQSLGKAYVVHIDASRAFNTAGCFKHQNIHYAADIHR